MPSPTDQSSDPFLWLEEVESQRALDWVRAETNATRAALFDAAFEADKARVQRILEAETNIPYVAGRGGLLYNLWTDGQHKRGLWRRTTLESFKTDAPDWDVVLDIDALGKAEGKDWVWRGATVLPPENRHAMISLSPGGSDAVVVREFDMESRRFVEDGFSLPEAKSSASWIDSNTLLVCSAIGEHMATTSGYARTVRKWKRGTPFEAAAVVYEVGETDMVASATVDHGYAPPRVGFVRYANFFSFEVSQDHPVRGRVAIETPHDAWTDTQHGWLTVRLRSDWTVGGRTHPTDALLAIDLERFLDGARDFTVLFEPNARRILRGFSWSNGHLALDILDNVQCRPVIATPPADGSRTWAMAPVAGLSAAATLGLYPRDGHDSDEFFVTASDPLTPPSLYRLVPGQAVEVLKRQPAEFDASDLAVTQHEAISTDGERIPYFMVARKGLVLDGNNATVLTGYGGFEIAMLPAYLSVTGAAWLEKGGVYVTACIRGGGEFGARWHKAGIREKKALAHDDFAAVAKDLITRKVTRPARLAASGGSNGGLLVGNMLTRYPELFGAIQCSVPLLDMQRYSKLLAGASWMAEYGDPDKAEDWQFMQQFSAYQNVVPGKSYPPILFVTSAKDDRVHPGHARKMAAKMQELGYKPMFFEPEAGGHGFADKAQEAEMRALFYAFLRHTIGEAGV